MGNKFDFVLFDMIGTTIKDSDNGNSLIINNFSKAFSINGFNVSFQEINDQRGKSKKEAVAYILKSYNATPDLVDKIYSDFLVLLDSSMEGLTAMDGAPEVFRALKEKGIRIGLGSGLPMEFVAKLLKKIGWSEDYFDYIGSSDDLGKGRPDPVMIIDAMDRLEIKDKEKFLKVGDTVVDVQEGKNAGVKTASVLTGTQKVEELKKFKPDYIFSNISEINTII